MEIVWSGDTIEKAYLLSYLSRHQKARNFTIDFHNYMRNQSVVRALLRYSEILIRSPKAAELYVLGSVSEQLCMHYAIEIKLFKSDYSQGGFGL